MAGPVHPSVGGSDHGKSDLVGASELVEMSGHDDLPARKRHPEAEIQGEPLRLVEISSLMAHSNLDWDGKTSGQGCRNFCAIGRILRRFAVISAPECMSRFLDPCRTPLNLDPLPPQRNVRTRVGGLMWDLLGLLSHDPVVFHF
jgi:hypothetical protein